MAYLSLIFFLGLTIRFLFFPENIYFGYDQARDAFNALGILHGQLKLIGPTSSIAGISHGVLYYYLIAPAYLIGHGDPTVLSIFLRVLNALGILVIFYLASIIFKSKQVSLIAALLYAVSFEQSQFSIYMGNPSLASITIMLMYLGLALVIFSKKSWGLILATFTLGLSLQFEIALFYLIISFLLIGLSFYKDFLKIPIKTYLLSTLVFLISVSTFIISEVKYKFHGLSTFLGVGNPHGDKSIAVIVRSFLDTLASMVKFNIWGDFPAGATVLILLLFLFIFCFYKFKDLRRQFIFLGFWFFSLFSVYLIGGGRSSGDQLYYTNVGVSQSILIFISFIFYLLFKKSKFLAGGLILLVIIANLRLMFELNPKGTINSINVQQGMLLKDEKKVLDIIYSDAGGKIFAAKALTSPIAINTTWAYLYEWYGMSKYGYVPIWGDKNAIGYPGHLKVIDAQNSLPDKRYVVLESPYGLTKEQIDDYLRIEGYFTHIEWEKTIGQLKVQKRYRY